METEPQTEINADVEIMLRVKAGDESAFEEIVRRFRPQLAGFFYAMCWNADTAQDCAQEVLLRLWLYRERYQPTSARLSSYVFIIARNHWASVCRKLKCRPKAVSLDEAWEPSSDEAGLERLVLRRYADRRIRAAISELPEHLRLVFVLGHLQGMKYAEISETLEIPVGTVKSRMSAAVRTLRAAISEEEELL